MKRLLYLVCCLSISLQMFAQSEIFELFPTLAGLERTNFTSYYHDDCCGESKSIHIASPTEIDSIDGNLYLYLGGFFLREENNKVLIYSFAYKKDFVLYDWSLEVGDTLPLLALDPYSFPDIEYPVVVDYRFADIEDENGNLISQKVSIGSVTVKEVSTVTLLDGKEYKKWSFQNDMGGSFEYIENIGCLKGYSFMGDCYFNLIQPEAITVCYQGEHLVCASKNGELLYQMSDAEMDSFGVGCKCLNNKTLNEDYAPMVVEGYSWNIITSSLLMFPDTKMYSTQKQKIEGDSIIDGIVYKKLWLYSDANSDKRSLITLVREDIEEQKVFVYDKGVEVLLYDLGVEVGDTIKVLGDLSNLAYSSNSINIKENLVIVVDKIDFIEDPIYGKLKVVSYYNADPNFNEFKCTVYERYGMTTGWLYNICMAYVGGASHRVICAFDENDELVLKREYTITGYGEVKDCYIKEEIGTNIETAQKEENIYYNSQEKTLYFDIKNAETITIHDAMGKMIINRTITSGIKQLPLNLNSGVYIIHFSSNNQQTIHTKIMVK